MLGMPVSASAAPLVIFGFAATQSKWSLEREISTNAPLDMEIRVRAGAGVLGFDGRRRPTAGYRQTEQPPGRALLHAVPNSASLLQCLALPELRARFARTHSAQPAGAPRIPQRASLPRNRQDDWRVPGLCDRSRAGTQARRPRRSL